MIPGDGVGPEMMDSVQEVLKAIGAPIDFDVHHLSEVEYAHLLAKMLVCYEIKHCLGML